MERGDPILLRGECEIVIEDDLVLIMYGKHMFGCTPAAASAFCRKLRRRLCEWDVRSAELVSIEGGRT